MERIIKFLLFVIIGITSCRRNPAAVSLSENKLSFTDKEWQINSIITEPPLLDVDGDDELDAEILPALEESERNRKIILSCDGEVFEKRVKKKPGFIEYEIVRNGYWKKADGDFLKWVQKDQKICVIHVSKSSENQLRMSSFDFENEIKVITSMNSEPIKRTKHITLED